MSINEQFVLRRQTHLKGNRGLEEGDHFPFSTPDQGLLQTWQTLPATSPLLTLEAALSPTPTIYPMITHDTPTTFSNPPIERPLQDGPSTGGSTHPGVGKHRLEYNPEFALLHTPDGHPTQNPEEERKTEVRLCYLASGSSF